jgi:hypothetical protein
MSRVERYKSIKLYKKRCRRTILLFLLFTAAGILIADYSINSLMVDDHRVNIISINTLDSQLELCFMNMKFYTDAEFLIRVVDMFHNIKNVYKNAPI